MNKGKVVHNSKETEQNTGIQKRLIHLSHGRTKKKSEQQNNKRQNITPATLAKKKVNRKLVKN